jgi:hypothetical protein
MRRGKKGRKKSVPRDMQKWFPGRVDEICVWVWVCGINFSRFSDAAKRTVELEPST